MLNEKCITLSKYRIEEARDFLNSGKKNLSMNEYKTANNRAYYSVFHAHDSCYPLCFNQFSDCFIISIEST